MKGKLSIYYDEKGDYLELFIKVKRPSYGEDIDSGITIFKDEETEEVIGIGILNFKKKTNDLNQVELNLPFEINFATLSIEGINKITTSAMSSGNQASKSQSQ
ncbi:DUF2283 domain-containing protein [Candidatus Woesearchaeota archaeon]|nr:DUF2283 domain-containing protein [Candidatus Woesearchaeota archaeon]